MPGAGGPSAFILNKLHLWVCIIYQLLTCLVELLDYFIRDLGPFAILHNKEWQFRTSVSGKPIEM